MSDPLAGSIAQELADRLDDMRSTEGYLYLDDGETTVEGKVEGVTDTFVHPHSGQDCFRVTVNGVVYLVSVCVAAAQ